MASTSTPEQRSEENRIETGTKDCKGSLRRTRRRGTNANWGVLSGSPPGPASPVCGALPDSQGTLQNRRPRWRGQRRSRGRADGLFSRLAATQAKRICEPALVLRQFRTIPFRCEPKSKTRFRARCLRVGIHRRKAGENESCPSHSRRATQATPHAFEDCRHSAAERGFSEHGTLRVACRATCSPFGSV